VWSSFVSCAAARDRALKYLIVTADDFGLADEVNQAVEARACRRNPHCGEPMVGAAAAAQAVGAGAPLCRGLLSGCIWRWSNAEPVLPPSAVPDLVDGRGRFRSNMALSGAAMFFLPHVRRQMRAEIRAQFEAFRTTGLKLDHVTAHKHFHLHPSILSAVIELAKEFGRPRFRAPLEPQGVLARIETSAASLINDLDVGRFGGHSQRARLKQTGIATPDHIFGLAWSGAMTHSRLQGLIAHLPEGVTEIYTHPATSSGFAGGAPGYRYHEELAGWLHPIFAARSPRLALFREASRMRSVGARLPTETADSSATSPCSVEVGRVARSPTPPRQTSCASASLNRHVSGSRPSPPW